MISDLSSQTITRRLAKACCSGLILAALVSQGAAAQSGDAQRRGADPQDYAKQNSLAALEGVLQDLRDIKDKALVVRAKSQAADVLWPLDEGRAKDLLAAAFDEIRGLSVSAAERSELRSAVVGVARKHDPQFTAQLIDRLSADGEGGLESISRDSMERISERGSLYLDTANDLLLDGNQERAIAFAQRSLSEGRSSAFLNFLETLAERDRKAADKLFLGAADAVRRTSADPNDVLLLGLYLFSPGRTQFADLNGQLVIGYGINFGASSQASPALLRPYLQAATEVLARFPVIPSQPDYVGRAELKRFALQQLLPLFDRYLPAQAAAMHAEVAQLSQAPSMAAPTEAAPAGTSRFPYPADLPTAEVVKRIEQLGNSQERDKLYFEGATVSLDGGDFERARELAAHISSPDLRQAVSELIEFHAALKAVASGELDEAERTAVAHLSPERLAVLYYRIAVKYLGQNNAPRASQLTLAASAQTAKIDNPSQRALVNIYLAAGVVKQDANRAFELFEAAVKDINSAGRFELNSPGLAFRIRRPNGAIYERGIGADVNLLSVVRLLARADFDRTLGLARSLRADELRVFSIIEACRIALAGNAANSTGG